MTKEEQFYKLAKKIGEPLSLKISIYPYTYHGSTNITVMKFIAELHFLWGDWSIFGNTLEEIFEDAIKFMKRNI